MMVSAEKSIKIKARNILSSGWAAPIAGIGMLLIIIFGAVAFEGLVQTLLDEFLNLNLEPRVVNNLPENYLLPMLFIVLSEIIPVLFILLMSPFFNGYIKMHYGAVLSGRYDISDMIYFFKPEKYWKTVGLNISFVVRLILPAIISFLPLLIFEFCTIAFFPAFTKETGYIIIYVILAVLSGIILILYSLRYFLVFKLYSIDDSRDISYYFNFSKQGMSENTDKVIKLTLSMIPLFLLSLLLLPIVYTGPYIMQSYCVCADYLIELKKETVYYDESIPMYNSL